MSETRQIVQSKELNITNINMKGATPHQKIGLPLISFISVIVKATTILLLQSVLIVSIPAPSEVLTIICGKILCEHCQ